MRALTENEVFAVSGADRGDAAVTGAVAGGTAGAQQGDGPEHKWGLW